MGDKVLYFKTCRRCEQQNAWCNCISIPGNESREHFLLKQVGLIWLKERGSPFVGTEIDGMYGFGDADKTVSYVKRHFHEYDDQFNRILKEEVRKVERYRSVADVVGVQIQHKWSKEKGAQNHYTIRTIEVKVSRSDFQSGYCTGGHLVYVMTPPGLVDPSELDKGVGLLEVDLDRVMARESFRSVADYVRLIRRPTRNRDYDKDAVLVVEAIARKYTNEAVYKNPWLMKGDAA